MADTRLNHKYFRFIGAQPTSDGSGELQVYAPVHPGSTLVLFSAAREPLAAVTFLSAGGACTALVSAYKRPNRFVALARVDNAEYSLVLTNLTALARGGSRREDFANAGMLKMDVLTEDRATLPSVVDLPTLGVNA